MSHSFNNLTQRLHVELCERGHEVSVELDIHPDATRESVALYRHPKELARLKSALAHSLPPYPSCLDQVERFFRLITPRPHPAPPTQKKRRPIGAYNAIARPACELLTRTPPSEPRATLSAKFRNGAASPERKLRNAGGALWLNRTSGECAYVHWGNRLSTVTERDIALVVEAIENKEDPP
ncbi:hypothetical protein [Bradyrhizobium sp. WSM4349]|uniref:hypothetical protein n=1 Tax=Bradyrhizobium sp. WSM4349 TaxID=1040988 RepID=UPI00039C96DD|nr:hypothetical protein [Bradyrhizobium sp. WSM4349]